MVHVVFWGLIPGLVKLLRAHKISMRLHPSSEFQSVE